MSEHDAATNIVNAFRVARHVHREVAALIGGLDDLLQRDGWKTVGDNNWLGLSQQGAKLERPDNWLATILNRAYGHGSAARERVILVEVHLAPTDWPEPVIAVAGLVLGTGCTGSDLWKKGQWLWPTSGPWFRAPVGSVIDLEPAAIQKVVPSATGGRGLLIALCSLDRTNLQERLAVPALRLVA